MTILSLDEILKNLIKWEKDLFKFYEMMEDFLKDERSREAIAAVKAHKQKTFEILESINISEYVNVEYVKNIPNYDSESFIPHYDIAVDSTPQQVFTKILEFEEKLEDYYKHLRSVVVYSKSKTLFDMLVDYKLGQIKELKSVMDSFDLAV